MGRWPLHPLLIGLFPILSLYHTNQQFTAPRELPLPIAASIIAALVLWGVFRLATGSWRRGGLLTTIVVALFNGLGQGPGISRLALERMSRLWVARDIVVETASVAVVLVPLAIAAGFWCIRTSRDLRPLDGLLNVLALALVAQPLVGLVPGELTRPAPAPLSPSLPITKIPDTLPDIYDIVLDGYPRADVLKTFYDLDNEPFLAELESRGFSVARKSTSNYAQTLLSLASSLNASYLDGLGITPEYAADRVPMSRLIYDSNVLRALRTAGYQLVAFDSGFDMTNLQVPVVDRNLSPYPRLTVYHQTLVDRTPLAWLRGKSVERAEDDLARDRIDYILDHLPDVATDSRPTFSFAHIVAPHPPFVFRADGSARPVDPDGRTQFDGEFVGNPESRNKVYVEGYVDAVVYLNRRLVEVIDRILAASDPERPPLIILRSDHGSGLRVDLNSAERTDMVERFANIAAVLWPGQRPADFTDASTPVNLYLILFNTLFDSRIPLRPDRNLFSTWNEPYRMIDVTEQVRQPVGSPAPAPTTMAE